MTQAFRIVGWRGRYEVTSKGKPASESTPIEDLRVSGFDYIRSKVHGHSHGPGWRGLLRVAWLAGDVRELAAFGLFQKLMELAADQKREFRGWILDADQRPLTASGIADELGIYEKSIVSGLMDLLCSESIGWVGVAEFQENPDFPPASPDAGGKEGLLVGENGGRLINETEVKEKVSINESEPGDPGVSVLKSDLGGPVSLNKQVAALKLSEIFVTATKSDHTTIVDILNQVDSLKYGDLIDKAKQCRGSNNPIAVFVAAAKSAPFGYCPVRRDRFVKT